MQSIPKKIRYYTGSLIRNINPIWPRSEWIRYLCLIMGVPILFCCHHWPATKERSTEERKLCSGNDPRTKIKNRSKKILGNRVLESFHI
uniref:Uncharacterized protein n=1 Tax=Romanomermis culicivorax TaxID=13658 RepID=A0A915I080_ROMCU